MKPYIKCDDLVKIYKIADLEVVALRGLDLEVEKGEMLALVGASGSGKSTLMNILGALDTPTTGQVWVGDYNLLEMTRPQQTLYRRTQVGFVWQQTARNLLPYLLFFLIVFGAASITIIFAARKRRSQAAA